MLLADRVEGMGGIRNDLKQIVQFIRAFPQPADIVRFRHGKGG
jgi:hypothetical protein